MARYKICAEGGVIDQDNGNAVVPPVKSDHAWRDYQAWIKAGNSPDPADPEPARVPEINYEGMAAAREDRIVNRLAKTDPVAALLRKEGMT